MGTYLFDLQITVTAALGFESFLVMRHGAGPLRSVETESVDALATEIGNTSLRDTDGGQRLGCYFCNDVVAPVDVCSFHNERSIVI